jgi:signal transduction histidine kinase
VKAFFGSMTGRVFLTLLLGVVISAGFTAFLSYLEAQRWEQGHRYRKALDSAEQLIMATEVVPSSARPAYLKVANRGDLRLDEVRDDTAPTREPSKFGSALKARLGGAIAIDSLPTKPLDCDAAPATSASNAVAGTLNAASGARARALEQAQGAPFMCEWLNVRLRDGDQLRLTVIPRRPGGVEGLFDFGRNYPFMLFLVVCIGLLAYLVARMTTRPLARLAQAAADLGNDINHPPLALAGASEIQQASAAFNAMQARVRKHIAQRTQMLAAITHDLQTPLTRLRLRLEKVADRELQERLIGDLSAMQAMVREGLELARSMDSSEAMQTLDLDSLLDSVCADAADAGQDVTLVGQAGVALLGRPMGLRRCLVNLIDNAVKYGQQASVTVERTAGGALIRIRDAGPGIAAAELARVFEPFYRVETSRSRDSGGTGLGLTIARNIAEQHHGAIALKNHADGGLEATLLLPAHGPVK